MTKTPKKPDSPFKDSRVNNRWHEEHYKRTMGLREPGLDDDDSIAKEYFDRDPDNRDDNFWRDKTGAVRKTADKAHEPEDLTEGLRKRGWDR